MLKHAAAEVPQRGVGPCLQKQDNQKRKLNDGREVVHASILFPAKKRLLNAFVNQMVASAFDLKADRLLKNDRGEARTSRARQIAMYLMNTSLSQTFVEIGNYYGRDRTTVSHACAVVEELRDRPEFDERLSELEQTIATVLQLIKPTGSSCNGNKR